MRIAILGAGVIGVTTAYELSRNPSNDIVVIDQATDVATEASGVNAAMIAPGHAYAWASPKVPMILLKSLYRNDQAFRIRLQFDLDFWKWTMLFLRQCNNADAIRNTIAKHALCAYSQKRLGIVAEETGIEYNRVQNGLLYLCRKTHTMRAAAEHSVILKDQGQQLEVLDADEVVDLEPAFRNSKSKIAGAIYCPTDETGNAQIFTRELADICENAGVRFQFSTKIQSLNMSKKHINHVETSNGPIEADLYIISLGAYTPLLLKPLNIYLPIYPVKGYSVTFPAPQSQELIKIGTVDEDNLVAFSPIGDALRATATAEFTGYKLAHKPANFKAMLSAVKDLIPNAANFERPTFSACLRPMTPQGTPYIGATNVNNLFINSGQGHMGWTMACGSAKIAADLIAGKQPEMSITDFLPTNRS